MSFNLKLPSPKKLKPVSAKQLGVNVALRYNPVAHGLFAAGAAVNKATGGKTTTYSLTKALAGKAPRPTYSTLTRAASGYSSATPGAGTWRPPVLNKDTVRFAAETAKGVGDAASEGLLGVKLRTLLLGAAGVTAGLATVAVATR